MKYNRREFIKLSGMAAIGTAMIPSFLHSCFSGTTPESAVAAMNHFNVSAEDLKKVILAALEKGGEYADLYFEHSISNTTGLRDGKVNNASSNIDFGVGIRVVTGEQTGYAYTEEITLEEMLKAAKVAARIASDNARNPSLKISTRDFQNYHPIETSWEDVNIQQKAPFLQKLNDRIFELDNRVTKVMVSLSDKSSVIMFYNSENTFYHDYRPMVTLSATCIMDQNGEIENSRVSRSFTMGFEFLNDDIIEEMAQEVVRKTSVLFGAIKPKGGEMPVVMGSGGSGILLHEAIGHSFEADANRKNTSIFSDKLGKKICLESINVVDTGTIPNNRGAVNIDDEGNLGQKTYIVKDGILNSYLHDRMSAKYYGVAPTGNGRRESFRFAPIPRMRSTYMEEGDISEADMIAEVKYGVYCDVFTNGEVQTGSGDFTFFVKSGSLIENGKITTPIKDINIIGNGPKALADIIMVSNNLIIDNGSWTCGKQGQSCPVTCGMPAALVSKLTVGGK
jgi:TldD protein